MEVFCAICQTETEHKLEVDHNGEVVLTCPCGHFNKWPSTPTSEQLAIHKNQNKK